MMMEVSRCYSYRPYFDPDFEVESFIDRIYPPRVCIDNDTCQDCTLVKVDSTNKHGILLDMVQVLTDLDLLISKSYICSDGGWFMDVFHVTDQLGNKLTDQTLIRYIQQAICATRKGKTQVKTTTSIGRNVRPRHVLLEHTALEMTGTDRPGLMSEISAVLAELGCHVSAAVAWTHNSRAACIIYVEDEYRAGPIIDPCRAAQVQAQLENVVDAHHAIGERRSVRLAAPTNSETHTERRLHQLMMADRDYEECSSSSRGYEKYQTRVTVENCDEKGYSIVNIRSRDRPKLLFDTVCTLTDMQYVVFHASVRSKGTIAFQEYYIRKKDGRILSSEAQKRIIARCLIAAVERRVSHGLRLDVCTHNRVGLLSDVTRVFRENGLSIVRAEVGIHGERALGSFYVTDASGHNVDAEMVEAVRREIGNAVVVVNRASPGRCSPQTPPSRKNGRNDVEKERPRFSLGTALWSQLEKLSNNFRPIRY